MKTDLQKYQEIEKFFFDYLDNNLKDNLLFYCVTGSLTRQDILAGWSDIDILLVFKTYNEKILRILSNALARNSSNIKIGTTFYSVDEFLSKNTFKDPKTVIALQLIKNKIYKPRKSNIPIDNKIQDLVDSEFYSWSFIISFTMILHEYKRSLISRDDFNEQKTYKYLNTILKIFLIRKDIRALSYKEVIDKSKKYLKGFNFMIELPEDILKNKAGVENRKKEYIKILNWLKKYQYV